jgi:hypothetical protein
VIARVIARETFTVTLRSSHDSYPQMTQMTPIQLRCPAVVGPRTAATGRGEATPRRRRSGRRNERVPDPDAFIPAPLLRLPPAAHAAGRSPVPGPNLRVLRNLRRIRTAKTA